MSKILDNFDINVNFWEVNKEFKTIEPFKKLYSNDKTKNKQQSSLTMWFVALCYDFDSKFFNLDESDRIAIVGKDFCGSESFYSSNKSVIDSCIERYVHITDSPAQKALREWNDKMMERARFMKNTVYTADSYEMNDYGKQVLIKGNAELLDKMMSNTKKLYDDLKRINEELSKEELSAIGKGGRVASLSDSGEI